MADEKIEIVIPKIKSPEEYENPTELYEKLIAMIKKYHPSDEISLIEKAYKLADDAHKEQKRRSGEPYIIHPLSVAIILAEFELDKETIIAGILHDVVEDTVFTLEEITEMFGAEVALLVDGVTKLTQVSYSADKIEIQAENLRKMFLAMGKDIRVILIKLADRLGISKIKVELDDLALKYLEPDKFADIAYQRNVKLSSGELMIKNLVSAVDGLMKDANIKSRVYGRMKHIFSIYKKMINQNKEFDQILDLFAVRIIVDSVKDCYAALGIIHEHYKPIQGRFKDYIAMPKSNMYQSLHTTLIGPSGQPFEIQIRTEEMHKTAENGIAAHWKYKEDPNGKHTPDKEEEKLSWLREILEWQNNLSDNKEFLSVIKSDFNLFTEDVYCFTPSGDVKNLPNGSTPIDFAYSIHSAVGNKMVGARVNGKIVNIDYKIQNGDRIEIITSQNSKGPSRDWLNIVKSSQAKNKINQWFKSEYKEDNIVKGRELIERYCKMKGVNISDLTKHEFVAKVLAKFNLKEWNAVLAAIGHGSIKEGHVINRLIEEYEKKNKKPLTNEQILEEIAEIAKTKKMVAKSRGGIVVKGVHDVSVRFSKCCNPVPGDEIVGFITRGRGISIHRTDCVNVMNLQESERVRLMEADWQEEREKGEKYLVEIQIFCNNRTGLLADISKIFTERNIDVQSMNSRTSKQEIATISMSFMIGGKDELNKLVDKIRMVDSVLDIVRASY